MAWPYHFVDLTEQQKHHRRQLLDRYGLYSQLSALIPILIYQLYRLGVWVHSERKRSKTGYAEVPSSPGAKKARTSTPGVVVRQWRRLTWWFGGEVAPKLGLGLKGQWIATGGWMAWLLFLCVYETGDDYLHLTKRFGEVAVAQFPLHYMLSMKSMNSPLALVFRVSHEELNPWHRLNAKVIYTLLLLHASCYMNFFFQAGLLPQKLQSRAVIIGLIAISMLTILVSTSLELVRRWNYRLFFIIHLVIGVALLPLLFFHASHLRLYVVEALALFVVDLLLRKLDTVIGFATITSVPHTKLIKLRIPIPPSKLHRFHAAPGQHVYVSIPAHSTPPGTSVPALYELLLNPFTVAEVSTFDITLVLRSLNGPATKALSGLTKLPKAKPPLKIEGPYGSSQAFNNLAKKYDRILFVSGGVGATYTLPIYKSVREQLDAESSSPTRARFIWAMRSAAEAHWAIDTEGEKKEIEDDANIQIYVSRSNADNEDHDSEPLPPDGSVELDEMSPKEEGIRVNGGRDRPDLKTIVDEVFKAGREERVAVLVCGPKGMARELRSHVGKWVEKGREVWFHDEGFGW